MHAAAELIKKIVRVREKNQITLPSHLIEGLPIHPGDFVEILRTAEGVLQIRPVSLIPLVNSPEASTALAEAETDVQQGNSRTFSSPREYADELRRRRAGKRKEKVASAAF